MSFIAILNLFSAGIKPVRNKKNIGRCSYFQMVIFIAAQDCTQISTVFFEKP